MGESGAKISAIVCTHNGSKYLKRAIESLIDQSLPKDDYEIIVVDNRSTDSTKEIAQSLKSEAGNLRYFYEEKLGLSHARNRGTGEARGGIVAFLDDDAYAGREWLELYVDAFEKTTPRPVASGGKIILDWEVPRPAWLAESMQRCLTYINYSKEPRFLDFQKSEYPFGANMAFSKKGLVELGGFATNLGRVGKRLLSNEEKELFSRIHEKGFKVYYVPEASVHHAVTKQRASKEFFFKRHYWQGISDVVWFYTHESKAGERGKALFYFKNLIGHMMKLFMGRADETKKVELGCRVRYYLGCLVQELRFSFRK